MTGRAVRLRRLLTASLAAGVFLITSSAGAAQSGVTEMCIRDRVSSVLPLKFLP